MDPRSYGAPFPSSAYWLSIIGGVFIILDGLLDIGTAIAYSSVLESIVPGATGLYIALGVIAIIFGLVIVFLALRLKSNPASVRTSGVVILVLALISLLGGGGFFIGAILALVGGVLALTWRSPTAPPSAYGQPGYGMPMGQPGAPPPWGAPPPAPMQAGAAQRFCPSCGSPNPPNARFCEKCGAPLS